MQNGEEARESDQKHITKKVSSSPKEEDLTCQVIAVADNLKPTTEGEDRKRGWRERKRRSNFEEGLCCDNYYLRPFFVVLVV